MDHGRSAMRAGAGRLAAFKVGQQSALFFGGQGLPALDCGAFTDTRRQTRFYFGLKRGLIFFEISTITRSAAPGSIRLRIAAGRAPGMPRPKRLHLEPQVNQVG